MKGHLLILTLAILGGLPAAAGITYTCAASVPTNVVSTTNVTTNLCSDLNGSSVAGVYSGIFSNINANIYLQFAGPGLAGSDAGLNGVSYASYLSALSSHEGDANDVIAVASLSATEPALYSGDNVAITSALAAALGLGGTAGLDANGNDCTLGSNGCYNGVITIGSSANNIYYALSPSDPAGSGTNFFTLIEHETDEILGTISCLGTASVNNVNTPVVACTDSNGNAYVAPADLFRYSAAASLSFLNNANGGTAYFSNNGGLTNIGPYNNSPNGADYGDWSSTCNNPQVQNAVVCTGNIDISNDGGAEIAVLDAVGFNLNTVPEPASVGLFGGALAILAFAYLRRKTA